MKWERRKKSLRKRSADRDRRNGIVSKVSTGAKGMTLAAASAALIGLAGCQTTGSIQSASAYPPNRAYELSNYPENAYRIVSHFGDMYFPGGKRSEPHAGVDIKAPTGTPVYAAEAGRVTLSHYHQRDGNIIQIRTSRTDRKLKLYYAHLGKMLVEGGEDVVAGQQIGTISNTGLWSQRSDPWPHLHFGVGYASPYLVGGFGLDPVDYLFGSSGGLECVEPGKEYSERRASDAAKAGRAQLLYPVACTRK